MAPAGSAHALLGLCGGSFLGILGGRGAPRGHPGALLTGGARSGPNRPRLAQSSPLRGDFWKGSRAGRGPGRARRCTRQGERRVQGHRVRLGTHPAPLRPSPTPGVCPRASGRGSRASRTCAGRGVPGGLPSAAGGARVSGPGAAAGPGASPPATSAPQGGPGGGDRAPSRARLQPAPAP